MPVNYEQLRSQMKAAGKVLKLRQDAFGRAAEHYASALEREARSDGLQERVEALLSEKPECSAERGAAQYCPSAAGIAAGPDPAAGL